VNSHKIYFASDFHLGVPDYESSLEREKKIVRWLDEIKHDATEIYLLGDVFDFWFEYKRAIPKGFVRLQGKIAEITDAGIPVYYFTGNHDMWVFDYLPKELGMKLCRGPIQKQYNSKKLFIGHGDGLGPGDNGYKFLKKVFANKLCQWLFARLHPNFGIWLAGYSSGVSREEIENLEFFGDEEHLVQFCKKTLETEYFDYFIFGHRHIPLDLEVGKNSRYINLGDWIINFTYAVFDGDKMELKKFEGPSYSDNYREPK